MNKPISQADFLLDTHYYTQLSEKVNNYFAFALCIVLF